MTKQKSDSGPAFVSMIGPVLDAVRDLGGSARPQEVYDHLDRTLGLTAAQLAETTDSGAPRYHNQMAWARQYLVTAGLLDASKRGVWSLTERGRAHPKLAPEEAVALYRAAQGRRGSEVGGQGARGAVDAEAVAPDDDLPLTALGHRARVLVILQDLTSAEFERFCQLLLREAGFQNVEVTGRAGDGGIDGVGMLQVNTLVSFKVLFQCKRYRETVGSGAVRDFRGAMTGRADKGIILTTGGFTADAKREAVRDGAPPIELVDGEKLVRLMEELEIGLKPVAAFRVDEEWFGSFERVVGDMPRP
jgi:restriction system protein